MNSFSLVSTDLKNFLEYEDTSEAGDVPRGRLGEVIEAEAGFCAHGAIGGHSHFGGAARA